MPLTSSSDLLSLLHTVYCIEVFYKDTTKGFNVHKTIFSRRAAVKFNTDILKLISFTQSVTMVSNVHNTVMLINYIYILP